MQCVSATHDSRRNPHENTPECELRRNSYTQQTSRKGRAELLVYDKRVKTVARRDAFLVDLSESSYVIVQKALSESSLLNFQLTFSDIQSQHDNCKGRRTDYR